MSVPRETVQLNRQKGLMKWVELYYSEWVRCFESGILPCLIWELQLLSPRTCTPWHVWALTHPHNIRLWLFTLLTNGGSFHSVPTHHPEILNTTLKYKLIRQKDTFPHYIRSSPVSLGPVNKWLLFMTIVFQNLYSPCSGVLHRTMLVFVLLHAEIQSDSLKLFALNISKSLKLDV